MKVFPLEANIPLDAETFSRISPNRLQTSSHVVQFIASNPRSTVKQIAKGVNLSHAAIRYILSDLQAQDVVIALNHLDLKGPRGRGRPPVRYLLKKALLISTPPRRYWQLSDRIITSLLSQMGRKATERFFRAMGESAAHESAKRWSKMTRIPMSVETFRRLLRQELNQVGYNADLSIRGKNLTITTRNCLYSEVSRKYEGLLCQFHETYYPTLLSKMCQLQIQTVGRRGCMARGDSSCIIDLSPIVELFVSVQLTSLDEVNKNGI